MLSTTTDWPSRGVIFSPSSREAMSGLPPGAVGMMMRIGRDGQFASCARADDDSSAAAVPPAVLAA